MIRTVRMLSAAAVGIAIASALPACTSAPDTEAESGESQSQREYDDAIADYARALPNGYTFPSDLEGADAADKWWWCSVIDAAWHAYFENDDEPAALAYLAEAATVDPGVYVGYEGPGRNYIDRQVRYIDGGIDSQYVEYTATACNRWASSLGLEL